MLQTPQLYPRAGSQSYPTPAATADDDGSTTITFGPERPSDSREGILEEGVAALKQLVNPDGNWIQTDPDKGWCIVLRLYSPLPAFFDKTWRPSEIELVS